MAHKRDDFTAATKELLAKRVCYRCSNPNCQKPTIGPSSEGEKTVNIGVAAHIKAAAVGGKRYDIFMTSEKRRHPDNGIWLCQSCSKLIDSDEKKYTVKCLKQWKKEAEQRAEKEMIEGQNIVNSLREDIGNICEDISRIKFYMQCLDRPAFMDGENRGSVALCMLDPNGKWSVSDPNGYHATEYIRRLNAFKVAIQNTIIALNTGVLRDNEGRTIRISEGKSLVENPLWRKRLCQMSYILVQMLRDIEELEQAIKSGTVNMDLVIRLEQSRLEIVQLMNTICEEAGINRLEQW